MRDHEFEVDRASAVAWREFQAQLADRLAAMEEDDVAVVEAIAGHEPETGAAPYVQFCAFGEGMLRGEVAGNHVLAEPWQLDAQGVRTLGEIGYAAPTYAPDEDPDHGSLNHYVDVEQGEADRLAVMATRALRDVFGVPHPALLTGDVDEPEGDVTEGSAQERADEPLAAFPHGGREELAAMVDRALTPYFGHEPRHDSDGDIPVVAGLSLFFVRVPDGVPVVELFGCVVTDVTDREAARREIAILNRDVRFAKFRLADDSIMVDLQLPAWPFVPEHLRAMVSMLTEMIAGTEDDLAERVGGRHVYDPRDLDDEDASEDVADVAGDDVDDGEVTDDGDDGLEDEVDGDDVDEVDRDEDDDEFTLFDADDAADEDVDEDSDDAADDAEPADDDTTGSDAGRDARGRDARGRGRSSRGRTVRDRARHAELVLAQLDAEQRGSVEPALAASICGHDADVILDLIRRDEEEEIGWRQARDVALAEGDSEGVAACESELRYAAACTRLLRRALRVVVEREAAREAELEAARESAREAELEAASAQERPTVHRSRRRPLPPRPSRSRTVPDPTIEEVDPDIWG